MVRIFKFLIALAIFGAVALIAFAYLGPLFGSDFSAPQTQVTTPVQLDIN